MLQVTPSKAQAKQAFILRRRFEFLGALALMVLVWAGMRWIIIDVTFDRYPYVAWATGLTNRFPVWALDGGTEAFLRRLDDSSVAARMSDVSETPL